MDRVAHLRSPNTQGDTNKLKSGNLPRRIISSIFSTLHSFHLGIIILAHSIILLDLIPSLADPVVFRIHGLVSRTTGPSEISRNRRHYLITEV